MSVGHLKHGANKLMISKREHDEVRRHWPGRDSPELLASHATAKHGADSAPSRPFRAVVRPQAKRSMVNQGFEHLPVLNPDRFDVDDWKRDQAPPADKALQPTQHNQHISTIKNSRDAHIRTLAKGAAETRALPVAGRT